MNAHPMQNTLNAVILCLKLIFDFELSVKNSITFNNSGRRMMHLYILTKYYYTRSEWKMKSEVSDGECTDPIQF